jgi:RHS repeat-associated protein
VIERMAYEPFGKRRFTNGQYDQAGTIDAQSTNRGFTGHEHLDSLDFIHMNARVYDPDIGRFLSPDPTIPYTNNPQSFNRYSYGMNNPLNTVDPTGFTNESTSPEESVGNPAPSTQTAEPADKSAQTNIQTAADPKAGKNNSGLGFKGKLSNFFEDAPINQLGKTLGALAAHAKGLATNDKALTDITMQDLQDNRAKNLELVGMLLGAKAPAKGPSLTTNPMRTSPTGSVPAQAPAQPFSKDKQALVEMAKTDKKTGITKADMDAYKDLNRHLSDPFPTDKVRGPEAHKSGAPSSQQPHGHIGPVNHIPIK